MKSFRIILSLLLISSTALLITGCNDQKNTALSHRQIAAVDRQIHNYLLNHPEILFEMTKKIQDKMQQEQAAKVNETIKTNADKLLQHTTSPTAGNKQGSTTLVEFFDYRCSHCLEMLPVIQKIMAANTDVKIIFKELPIFGKPSEYASSAALAANKQGQYIAMHDALFAAGQQGSDLSSTAVEAIAEKIGLDVAVFKQDMQGKSVQKELTDNHLLAQKLDIQGTPAFIIAPTNMDGIDADKISFIAGAVTFETLQQALDKTH